MDRFAWWKRVLALPATALVLLTTGVVLLPGGTALAAGSCNGLEPTPGSGDVSEQLVGGTLVPGGTAVFQLSYPSGSTSGFTITQCLYDGSTVLDGPVTTTAAGAYTAQFTYNVPAGAVLGSTMCLTVKTTGPGGAGGGSNRKTSSCFLVGGTLRVEKHSTDPANSSPIPGATFTVSCTPVQPYPPVIIAGLTAGGQASGGYIAITGPATTPCTVTETAPPPHYGMPTTTTASLVIQDPQATPAPAPYLFLDPPLSPDLAITKVNTSNGQTSATVNNGSTVQYTLSVSNQGTESVLSGDATVTDMLPAGLTPTGATGTGWTCTVTLQQVSCTSTASIPAGNSAPAITVTASSTAAVNGTTVTNSAQVQGPTNDTNTSDKTATATTTFVAAPAPNLAITKINGSTNTAAATLNAGESATYLLTASNVGNDDVAVGDTHVTDSLPSGLTLVSVAGTDWACTTQSSAPQVSCTYAKVLPAGQAAPVLTVLADSTIADAGSTLSDTARVSDAPSDANAGGTNKTATASTTFVAPHIAIVKSGPSSVAQGDEADYLLTVTNQATASGAVPGSATITVTDAIPAGLTLVSASGTGWTCGTAGLTVTCTRSGPLAVGVSANPILVKTTANGSVLNTPIANTAVVSLPAPFPGDSSTTHTTVTAPDLKMTKTGSPSVAVGQTAAYTLGVQNVGTADVPAGTTITVTDRLPSGLTIASAAGAGWTCSTQAAAPQATCTRADGLAAGASTPDVTVTATANGTVVNTSVTDSASVSGSADSDPSNNTATYATSIAPAPVVPPPVVNPPVPAGAPLVSLTKTSVPANGSAVHPGDVITYTLSYANTGTADATNVTITDTLPADLTITGIGGATQSGQTLTWTRDIAAGTSGSVTYVATVASTATNGEILHNVAVATGGASATSNAVDHPVAIPLKDVSALVKSVDKSAQVEGGTLHYTLVVTAPTSGPRDGVTVFDTVPTGTTYVAGSCAGATCSIANGVVTWNVGHLDAGQSKAVTFDVTIDPVQTVNGAKPAQTITNIGRAQVPGDPDLSSNAVTVVVQVLGEKVTRPPAPAPAPAPAPQVLPVAKQRLPFTGLPLDRALGGASLLTLFGTGLVLGTRRRREG